jgi:hypothetical protein
MAALIGVGNPERPGSELVKAYITLTPAYQTGRDAEALTEEILAYAREKLSPYEVPKTVEIRAELPLTTVGKVDKKVLRQEARTVKWTGSDRRQQTREKVNIPCDLRGVSHGKKTFGTAQVMDLSRVGMYLETPAVLDVGTDIDANINLEQLGKTVPVKGRVLRSNKGGMAVRFTEAIPREIDRILTS